MAARTGIMLAHTVTPERLKKLPDYVLLQPKINGMRCRAVVEGSDVTLYSSQGNPITCVPHIANELRVRIAQLGEFGTVFDGELYIPGMAFQDIMSRTKRHDPHPASLKVQYHIFDLIDKGTQVERIDRLSRFFMHWTSPYLVQVPTYRRLKDMIPAYLDLFRAQGYEGVIIRNPTAHYVTKKTPDLLKLKTRQVMQCAVLSFNEEHDIYGEPKGQLGSVSLRTPDGNIFDCGSSTLTHTKRDELWTEYRTGSIHPIEWIAHVKFPELTKRGVPHHPILLKLERSRKG